MRNENEPRELPEQRNANGACGDTEKVSAKPYNPYEETVPLMLSDDYEDRFVAEYLQTRIRYEKLKAFNTRIEAAQCHPIKVEMPHHDCDLEILREQQRHMGEYLHILELRAVVEGIEL